jgi:hypothetical protein
MIPSKMHTCVAPCLLIPAQTCTFMECFGRVVFDPLFGSNDVGEFLYNCTVVSSDPTAFAESTPRLVCAQSTRFCWFCCRISWQYADPR